MVDVGVGVVPGGLAGNGLEFADLVLDGVGSAACDFMGRWNVSTFSIDMADGSRARFDVPGPMNAATAAQSILGWEVLMTAMRSFSYRSVRRHAVARRQVVTHAGVLICCPCLLRHFHEVK